MKKHDATKYIYLLLLLIVSATGCKTQEAAIVDSKHATGVTRVESQPAPKVSFVRSESMPEQRNGALQAVTIVSSFEASGLEGQQVIYWVRIVDRNGQPIASKNGQYETKNGGVGARRALLVLSSAQAFNDVSVSIPTYALDVKQRHLPISAHIDIGRPDGRPLASNICPIPVSIRTKPVPLAAGNP